MFSFLAASSLQMALYLQHAVDFGQKQQPVCWNGRVSARKKLIHVMLLNTDRPINRAPVAACAISTTRNRLKLNMLRTLNPQSPFNATLQYSCRNVEVAEAVFDAGWRSRTDADHQSTNRPLRQSACPPRSLRHSRWLLRMQACPSARAGVALTIESGADTQSW
jgi:hypothetical protein